MKGARQAVPCLCIDALSQWARIHRTSTSIAPHSTILAELLGDLSDIAARQAAPCSINTWSCRKNDVYEFSYVKSLLDRIIN